MNAREFEKKYKLSLDSIRPAISQFAPKDDSALNSIAGKPKKLLVEIIKRFFTNWVAVAALFVFITILVISIFVTETAKYSATKPLYNSVGIWTIDPQTMQVGKYIDSSTSNIIGLPPMSSPWYPAQGHIDNYETLINTWASRDYYGGVLWRDFIYFGENNPANAIKIVDISDSTNKVLVNAYVFNKVQNIGIALEKSQIDPSVSAEKAREYIQAILNHNPQFSLSTYLGTNQAGVDIWTQSWVGTWEAIKLALIVVTIQTIIGVAIGAYLGFHVGTWIDTTIMRLIDIFMAPPTMIWLLIFAATFGTSNLTLGIALVFIGWVRSVGSTRMFIITVKDQEYITASQSIGASKARLIYKHALPAIIGKISTSFVASIPSIIMQISSLAFLGFFKSDSANLGTILSNAASQAGDNAFILILPASILLLISVSLHFVALGVHDALDPKVIKTR
ncbi:ABC transporter permease [Mycoplasma sp. 4463]|uniref:ABC transporter permease n=1 Tax=Mycoplasma sp. 4463 TaxID=3400998 RepID=UPI003AAF91F2